MAESKTLVSLDAYLGMHAGGDVVVVYKSGALREVIQLTEPDLTIRVLRELKDGEQLTLAELDTKYGLSMTAPTAFGVFRDLERLAQLGALEIKQGESGRHSRFLRAKEPRLEIEAPRVDAICKRDYSRVMVKLASAK